MYSAPGRFWAENSITAGGVIEPVNQREILRRCDIFVPVIAVQMEKLREHILKEGIEFCFSGSIGDRLEEKLLLQGERMLGGVFPEATYTLDAEKIIGGEEDGSGPFGRAQELTTIWVGQMATSCPLWAVRTYRFPVKHKINPDDDVNQMLFEGGRIRSSYNEEDILYHVWR